MSLIDPKLSRAPMTRMDPDRVRRLNELWDLIADLEREDAEQRRYGAAATTPEPGLCSPVDYGGVDLSFIPQRILDVDYGCGDPTRYAERGESVLDLGSGSGKHCFMLANKVGADGHIIGIDKTPAMLDLARGAIAQVTTALEFERDNVEFRCGYIENLHWDIERLRSALATHGQPTSYADLERLERELDATPLVASNSVDLVVSNCVLNLVDDGKKRQLFDDLLRVLKRGGRAVISDIVADADVPDALKADEELWTGCVSGAMRRDLFIDAFVAAGFYGVHELQSSFWQQVEGVNFHSVTICAYKGKLGPCYETYRQAMYLGPFSQVADDDGHVYRRAVPVAVCEKTANLLTKAPYGRHFLVSEALCDATEKRPFDCSGDSRTVPSQLQQRMSDLGRLSSGPNCGPGCC